MSMRSGSSLTAIPACASARHNGPSAMGKTTASGWWRRSHPTVVAIGLVISEAGVGSPSRASFSEYCAASRVGLLDRNRTGMRRRRNSTILAAPGSSAAEEDRPVEVEGVGVRELRRTPALGHPARPPPQRLVDQLVDPGWIVSAPVDFLRSATGTSRCRGPPTRD